MNIGQLLLIIETNIAPLHRICKTCNTVQLVGDRCSVCMNWVPER